MNARRCMSMVPWFEKLCRLVFILHENNVVKILHGGDWKPTLVRQSKFEFTNDLNNRHISNFKISRQL
jgi:hypothetical protein